MNQNVNLPQYLSYLAREMRPYSNPYVVMHNPYLTFLSTIYSQALGHGWYSELHNLPLDFVI